MWTIKRENPIFGKNSEILRNVMNYLFSCECWRWLQKSSHQNLVLPDSSYFIYKGNCKNDPSFYYYEATPIWFKLSFKLKIHIRAVLSFPSMGKPSIVKLWHSKKMGDIDNNIAETVQEHFGGKIEEMWNMKLWGVLFLFWTLLNSFEYRL